MKKILVLLLALSMALSLAACGGSVDKFKTYVQNEQYDEALALFSDRIAQKTDQVQEVGDFLNEELDNTWNDFQDEKISAEELEWRLNDLQRLYEGTGISLKTLQDIRQAFPQIAASKAAYQKGQAALNSGDYETALSAFAQVSQDDRKNYSEAQTQIRDATDRYVSDVQTSVQEKIAAGDLGAALALLDKAEQLVGSRQELLSLRSQLATAKFETEMNELAERNDYATMRVVYAEAQQNADCSVSAQMTQLLADQELQFRRDIVERSIQAYRETGYQAAIPVIAEGLAVLPDDPVFLDFEAKYKSCAPVSLFDLERLNGYWDLTYDTVSDIYGNKYGKNLSWCYFDYDFKTDRSVELTLGRKYASFQAVIFPLSNEQGEARVMIYADDVLLFDETFVQKTEPVAIDIPVKNANFLKIQVEFVKRAAKICFAEPILTRELSEADLRDPLN